MVECPVCLRDVKLSENAREGDVIQRPFCMIWFKLVRVSRELVGERIE